jgi:O-antigen/teichoic acid export membrane protein
MRINSTHVTRNPIASRLISLWNRLDHHMREVIHGASVAFVLKALRAVLVICFNVLLARMLGAEGAGVYYLALTVATVATVFGRMGLDNALLRFVAANSALGDWATVKGVYRKGIGVALSTSAVSALAVFLAAPLLSEAVFSKPELTRPIRWMSLAVLPMAMVFLHANMLKGLKRIRDGEFVFGVGVPAVSLLVLYLLGSSWGVTGAVWAYTLGAVVTAVSGLWLWRSAVPRLTDFASRFEMRDLLKCSLPLFWVAVTQLVLHWLPLFLLGVLSTSTEVGIFGVATRTAMLIGFALLAVNSILAPKFADLHNRGDTEALGRIARKSARLVTVLASPVFLLFFFASEWVMGIFGPRFADYGAVLAILAVGQFVTACTGSVGNLLVMSGQERIMRNIYLTVGTINFFLLWGLISVAGVFGAAAATALSLSAINIAAAYFVWSRYKIWTLPFLWSRQREASGELLKKA